MPSFSRSWLLAAIFAAIAVHPSLAATMARGRSLRTSVFLSPPFTMGPGSVVNKFYYDVDFPRGHIAIKSLDAEVVDEAGNSVPLHETYVHHWAVVRFYGLKQTEPPPIKTIGWEQSLPKAIPARNAGICSNTLSQYFGLGSETRRTLTWVPDPYGIEAGNPEEVPYGYEERWMLNVHAIDTRGAVDRLGCTECRCDLYNVTVDEHGRPLREGYAGGMFCCYDGTRCRVKRGSDGDVAAPPPRKLYLKYTVRWVSWDDGAVVPVKIYILDVTGRSSGERSNSTTSCKVEYEVESCGLGGGGAAAGEYCVDNKRTRLVMPRGGDVVYGVSHQHMGGLGAALYGQDGRLLCSSTPVYGGGEGAGDEAGYLVGMSTCYPTPGSVSIADGEVVTVESNYSSTRMHTGVMGFFYLLVADRRPSKLESVVSAIHGELLRSSYFSWLLVAVGVTAASVAVARYRQRREREGYQSLAV